MNSIGCARGWRDETACYSHSFCHHPVLGAMEKPGAPTGAGAVPRALPGAISSTVSGALSITDRLKGDES